MKPVKGFCKDCVEVSEMLGVKPQEKWLANKSKALCKYHNEKRKKKDKPTKNFIRKKTGELDMFEEIWDERQHVSEVSGEPLGDILDPWFFAHLLPKGSYPAYRLRKENIILLTKKEHTQLDHSVHTIKNDPNWEFVFRLRDDLKIQYNQEMKVKKV